MWFLRLRPVALLIACVVGVLAGVFPGATAVSAESPTDTVASLVSGVYVAPGRDIDPAGLAAVVEEARLSGLRLVIVAPLEPLPTTDAFAKRIRQAAEVDAVLVFGPEGDVEASVTDDFSDGFARAEAAARTQVATPTVAAQAFLTELQTEPPGGLPDMVDELVKASVGLVVLIGLATGAEIMLRSRRAKRVAA